MGATTTIYTIGHGNRATDDFLALLNGVRIECLVDVRAYPASRRHPQFTRNAFERMLAASGIDYHWNGRPMGGLRKARPGSPHLALRNASFRAYADHMMTGEFQEALSALIAQGNRAKSAIMCAERLPWRCHRSLISDSLLVRGVEVLHLIDAGEPWPHRLNAVARLDGGAVVYDGDAQRNFDFRDLPV